VDAVQPVREISQKVGFVVILHSQFGSELTFENCGQRAAKWMPIIWRMGGWSTLSCCPLVCCSVLQCAAACCSVLQCVADANHMTHGLLDSYLLVYCNMLLCVAVCCRVLQCVAVGCSMFKCVAESVSLEPRTCL